MTTPIGVNSFRSSFQIATKALSKSIAAPSRRYLSSCHSSTFRLCGHEAYSRPCLPSRRTQWLPSPRRAAQRSFKILPGHLVLVNYVDLPPNYTDEGGLPFRRTDLEAQEVVAIFGPEMSTLAGNKLLRILHGRRVAGTLEDPELQIHTRQYNKRQQALALEYLRRSVPVDEISNAGLRAEDELAALEAHEQQPVDEDGESSKSDDLGYSSRYKLFKEAPQTPQEIYGVGAFDKVRAARKAKWEEELKRREEEKKRQEEEEAKQNIGGLAKIDPNQPRQPSVKMQEYLAAGQSELQEPPTMTKWERLFPATALVLVFTGVWIAYAHFYQAPAPENRLYPDISPSTATVGAIILANLLVFAAWRVPPLWSMLNQHFILTSATPRMSAVLGAMFSHQNAGHLFMNMAALWLFGTRLHDEVGRGNYLAVYFGTGAVGFLGTLYSLVLRDKLLVSTLGASGAVFGTMAAYLWLHRFDYFKLFELPPDPFNGVQGLGILAFVVALHIPHLFFNRKHKIDVASHLVGIATGVTGGHFLEKKLRAGRQLQQQQKIHMGPAVVGKGAAHAKQSRDVGSASG